MKILFVYEWLVKAGAQRYLYELVSALKSRGHEVGVVCGINSSCENTVNIEHYFFELKKEKVSLYPLIAFKEKNKSIRFRVLSRLLDSIDYRLNIDFLSRYFDVNNFQKIEFLFNKYDRIEIIDFNTYLNLKTIIDKYLHKTNVHILCSTLQFTENFLLKFNNDFGYNICYPFNNQVDEFKKSSLKINSLLHLPLSIDFSDFKQINTFQLNGDKINIGVFTRIAFNKNIDIFVFAIFTLLSKFKKSNIYLKVFGFVEHEDYKKSLTNLIHFYQLNDYISFENQTNDFRECIIEHNLSLAWFHFSGDFPGYAGIEVASIGLPSIFFNVTWETETPKDFPLLVVSDIDSLVFQTIKLVQNNEYLKETIFSQMNYLKSQCDVTKNIVLFENFLNKNIFY